MTALLERTRPAASAAPVSAGGWDGVILGAVATLIGVAFSWVPSLWYDEAATAASATRSWASMERMWRSVDLVHALYYSGMHVWFDLVGSSPFTLRLPSAVAAGLSVAVTVALVRRLGSRRLSVTTGIVLLLLPRFTWAAAEGRSYSATVLLAAASTLALVRALGIGGRPRAVDWTVFAVVSALSIAVFAYLALALVAQVVVVALAAALHGLDRRAVLRTAIAAGAAIAVTAPLLVAIAGQSSQLAWIPAIGWRTVHAVVVTQFFPRAPTFAVVGVALAAVGVVRLARQGRRSRWILLIATVPVLVPTLALLLASVVVAPLYSPRYLTFALPGLALLFAAAIDGVRPRLLLVGSVIAIGALVVPTVVGQRAVEAKQSSSWSEVAAVVTAERLRRPEAVVFGALAGHPRATARVISAAYPAAFAGLDDPALTIPLEESDGLWPSAGALDPAALADHVGVWLVAAGSEDAAADSRVIAAAGFTEAHRWRLGDVELVHFAR